MIRYQQPGNIDIRMDLIKSLIYNHSIQEGVVVKESAHEENSMDQVVTILLGLISLFFVLGFGGFTLISLSEGERRAMKLSS